MHDRSVIAKDFTAYLNTLENKSLLRFITCGSVDDGKSTLIGRLLFESHMIYEDQLASLVSDSKRYGTTGEEMDFALLVDGLASEREQGITIDVAYRFFSTDKRKFIVADTPGHEQYTRNMATGASTAELAIVMVDARKGLLTQTKRHSFIVSMLGVKHIVLAVNKMDLLDYDQTVFERIKNEYQQFAQSIEIKSIQAIPVSALKGDNIVTPSSHTPWYHGPVLIQYLEDINVESEHQNKAFRMPVQWVNRPHADFRGFAGRVSSGVITIGDPVLLLPGGKETEITRIVTYDGDLKRAETGQSITVQLKDEIDVSRGDVMACVKSPCQVADQFETQLLWMSEHPMIASRQYIIKTGATTALCTLNKPKHRIDVNSLQHLAAKELTLNEIGCCHIAIDRAIAYETYDKNRDLGSFILIDRMSNETVAAGLIQFALRRSTNVYEQDLLVNQEMRSAIKAQKPLVVWFTGLSGAGKSTIANLVEYQLNSTGKHTMLLDGDNIRHGLNKDLGFTVSDRAENIRRIAEVAKLMSESGLITLVSFISPFAAERKMARELIGDHQFLEVFVDAPLRIVQERDVKGLYQKAKSGEIKNFTGIGSSYEVPESPDLILNTVELNANEAAAKLLQLIKEKI
ncbi:sulfate adenylyltransferase subunit CysN [Legionella israelensis]|uniref:Multifunctional fusion protein n=1 Tax=Legionella israelensis TaxID=454 RepID=A0A0W0WNV0_9GAMM|nr:sulfate adenylyltransferase subunit CysN [Legionella israelensis]KTD33991.1 elongation factor Tu (EF-Tu) [Legionella israelensis]QBS10674.1 sulfate adenylyltransferase subunit CysN [Legionella israelensis]SCX84012.1 bifunctional enzyme CysN/CysC [Legionella israelensis DSM 19235]STX57629.1 elongation factor Tu (EF-Tu) [Legionella israelensis]